METWNVDRFSYVKQQKTHTFRPLIGQCRHHIVVTPFSFQAPHLSRFDFDDTNYLVDVFIFIRRMSGLDRQIQPDICSCFSLVGRASAKDIPYPHR